VSPEARHGYTHSKPFVLEHRMRPSPVRLAGALALAAAFHPAVFAGPERWFPLDAGNRWTYVSEELGGAAQEAAVLGFDEGLVRLESRGRELRLRDGASEIDIALEGEGLVPHYRFEAESFLHRDVDACDDGRRLTAAPRREAVETPAGTFADCLRLDYEGGLCADAGTVSEWWAPGTGLVQWVEDSFIGPRTWRLQSFTRGPRPFLRGDANEDGAVDVSDAVFILRFLFLGGPGPSCLDAADADDDGRLELTDAIFALNHLFLGGPPPPPPGTEVKGFDETTDDPFPCGDPPAVPCETSGTSTLPGVRADLSGNPCHLTLEQAASGVSFSYRIVIEAALAEVRSFSLDGGRCERPDASGLAVLESIGAGSQLYCLCDVGRCFPAENEADLVPGVYEARFDWQGRNWQGPSDTNNLPGDPFPPGTYRFEVRAAGTYGVERTPWEVSAGVDVHLWP
jgi:hypothetical protein